MYNIDKQQDLLYSTGNYIQCLAMENNLKKNSHCKIKLSLWQYSAVLSSVNDSVHW